MGPRIETLLTAGQVSAKVAELADEISRDYAGKDLLLVCILKGAFVFCSDLVRHLKVPAAVDFIACSSYGRSTHTSGVVRIMKDLDASVEGRHVLLVEDIADTGLTLRYLRDYLSRQRPASVETCVLLDKTARRQVEVPVKYRGFTIPDVVLVGYGIDWDEQYRHLPDVGMVMEEGPAPEH